MLLPSHQQPKGTGRMGKLLPLFGNLGYFTSKIIRAKDLIIVSTMGFHLRKEIGVVPPDKEQAISWSFLGRQEALLTSGAYPPHALNALTSDWIMYEMQLLICINFVRIFITFEDFEMCWLLETHLIKIGSDLSGNHIYPGILPKQKIKKLNIQITFKCHKNFEYQIE